MSQSDDAAAWDDEFEGWGDDEEGVVRGKQGQSSAETRVAWRVAWLRHVTCCWPRHVQGGSERPEADGYRVEDSDISEGDGPPEEGAPDLDEVADASEFERPASDDDERGEVHGGPPSSCTCTCACKTDVHEPCSACGSWA
jgi:hypothetical protein